MRTLFAKILADSISPSLASWSRSRERSILAAGEPLPSDAVRFAADLGIVSPDSLRLEITGRIPAPIPTPLIGFASRCGLPLFAPGGMCLGRGISAISADPALIRHELVHTLQYQKLGGHQPFMWQYVFEMLNFGYSDSPLEIEAQERSLAP